MTYLVFIRKKKPRVTAFPGTDGETEQTSPLSLIEAGRSLVFGGIGYHGRPAMLGDHWSSRFLVLCINKSTFYPVLTTRFCGPRDQNSEVISLRLS